MKIQSITTEHFKSIKGPLVLDFDALGPGLFLVKGKNGSGKSSMFEAVHWILLDQTSRGQKAGNIRTWGKEGTTSSVMELEGHRIERTWGPKSLKLDGEDIAQPELEKALGISSTSLPRILHFSQFEDFFLDLKPEARMELYGEVMGLSFWDDKAVRSSKLSKEAGQELIEQRTELVRAQERLYTLQEENDAKAEADWEREQKKELAELAKDAKQQEAAIKKLEALVAADKKKALALALEVTEATTKLQTAEDAHTTSHERTMKRMSAVAVASSRLEKAKKDLESFLKLGKGKCEHCGQEVPSLHKKLHAKELSSLVQKHQRDLNELKQAKAESEDRDNACLKQVDYWRAKKTKAKEEYAAAVRSSAGSELVEEQNSLDKNKAMQKRLLAQDNPFTEKRKAREKTMLSLRAKIKKLEAEIKDSADFVNALDFWQKGFKDIRFQVVRGSLTQLNVEVNDCLAALGLPEWQMNFEVEQETKRGSVKRGFLCTIKAPGAPESGVPWESWSGGESQRMRVAAELGISNLLAAQGISSNVEFWDEPSEWLEEDGIKALLEVLQERADTMQKTILLADHRVFDYSFDGVLHVTKTGKKGTTLEVVR